MHATLEFLQLGPRKVTAPLWAAMYAAPLTSLRPLNAVLSVYGITQSGKSTLAHLALTHFGTGFVQGRDYHAPIDWTSTVTAIEAAMFHAKDVPLVIDDFAPQFSSLAEARAMHKKAHHVVRSVRNRSARGRSPADLSQQNTRFPRGLVIMTAENPLIGQSIVGRMLYVGVEPGDILPTTGNTHNDENKLTHLQNKAQQGLLAQAMKLYLQYLAGNRERIAKEYPALVWYWCWVEYQLVLHNTNIIDQHIRLKNAIKVLTVPNEHHYVDINLQNLFNIICSESCKSYLIKNVDDLNKYGVYFNYKQIVAILSQIILAINPTYPYPHMLVTTVIEGIHHQKYFAEHLPSLTDKVDDPEYLINFYFQLAKNAINQH